MMKNILIFLAGALTVGAILESGSVRKFRAVARRKAAAMKGDASEVSNDAEKDRQGGK